MAALSESESGWPFPTGHRLKPPLNLHQNQQAADDTHGQAPKIHISEFPLKFRKVLKVHTVDTDKKGQRKKDEADYGETVYHPVCSVADDTEIQIQCFFEDFPLHRQILAQPFQRADHVYQERLRCLAYKNGLVYGHLMQHLRVPENVSAHDDQMMAEP